MQNTKLYFRGKSEPKVFPIFTSTIKADGKSDRNFIDLSTLNPKQTEVARAIQSRYAKGYSHHAGEVSGVIHQVNQPTHSNDRVYSDDGISPSLNTMQGDRRQPKVLIPTNTKLGYDVAENRVDGIRLQFPGSKTVRGRVTKGVSQTLQVGGQLGVLDTKIRRLTPLECERLMSWPDNWTKEPNVSDTQRYKMCGNGVVSKVVEAIIERLYYQTN